MINRHRKPRRIDPESCSTLTDISFSATVTLDTESLSPEDPANEECAL